jgi:hypothetical protein
MLSRFAIAVLFAGFVPFTFISAQETNDVVIGNADDHAALKACGVYGQAYFYRHVYGDDDSATSSFSLVRSSHDGAETNFTLPLDERSHPVVAEGNSGVNVLLDDDSGGHKSYAMYHFDSQGKLLVQRQVQLDLEPSRMAITASGKTVIVGAWSEPPVPKPGEQPRMKNGGVVLDSDDQVIKRFELPLPPEGGGWIYDSRRMLGGDDAAYFMLHSYYPPTTGLARIGDDGELEIKVIPNTPNDEERHHNEWTFGPDVLVEVYHYVRERSIFHFDEYDLSTGERTRIRYAFISGGSFACYSGNEISMASLSGHVDPARKLSPGTVRLVFGKLQDQVVSKPVVNPDAY